VLDYLVTRGKQPRKALVGKLESLDVQLVFVTNPDSDPLENVVKFQLKTTATKL
jgi:hypothetical protein